MERPVRGDVGTETLPHGVAVTLPAHLEAIARDLAEREAACCSFLDFDVRSTGDEVQLRISSQAPGAEAVIAMLVGAAS